MVYRGLDRLEPVQHCLLVLDRDKVAGFELLSVSTNMVPYTFNLTVSENKKTYHL